MKRRKVQDTAKPFVEQIRQLEERLFGDQLQQDASMMKSARSFWHFRPSHHFATGLLMQEDVALLKEPGKRLLSIGAHPAYLERVLLELGVPAENILVADKDAAIATCGNFETLTFDALDPWPETGTFDRIIFPECLATILGDRIRENGDIPAGPHPTDALEATLLAGILREALKQLRPGGSLRANGPMSHPNVMAAVSAQLKGEGLEIAIESSRFFLSVLAVTLP